MLDETCDLSLYKASQLLIAASVYFLVLFFYHQKWQLPGFYFHID